MKRFFFAIVAFSIWACSTPGEGTQLVLHVGNLEVSEATIIYRDNIVSGGRNSVEAEVNGNRFTFDMPLTHPTEATLVLSGTQVPLFLIPEKNLRVNISDNLEPENISFSGKNANDNYFLQAYREQIESQYNQRQTIDLMREASAKEFAMDLTQILMVKIAFLDDYKRESEISEEFASYFETRISYEIYTDLFNYSIYFPYFHDPDSLPEMPEDYYDFVFLAMDFSEDKTIVPAYMRFLSTYVTYYDRDNDETLPYTSNHIKRRLHIANDRFEGRALQLFIASELSSTLNFGEFDLAVELTKEFLETNPHQDISLKLNQIYDQVLALAPGEPAPGFQLEDIDGNALALDDFLGRVVYLDFWASWCGPCIREIPFAKELKKRFQDENDLVFLYVSLDEDADAWRKMVEDRQIEGVHTNISGFSHPLAEKYNIMGVPTFYIIGRDGNIFHNRPDRPSGENIDEQLNQALQKELS